MRQSRPASRVIGSLVAAFTVCVAAVGWLVVQQSERAAEAVAGEQVEAMARAAETSLNRALLGIDLMLAGLPELPGLEGLSRGEVDPESATRLLRARAVENLAVHDLIVLDPQGRVLAAADESTGRIGVQLPAGFLAELSAQTSPRLAISAPTFNDASGEKVLYLARVLRPSHHLVVAEVPVASMTSLMAPSVVQAGVSITIEDDRGTLLASAPVRDSLLGRRHASPLAGMAADGRAVRATGRLDDVPSYLSVRPGLYPNLRVSAALSEAEVHARTRGVRTAAIALVTSFVLLGLAAGLLVQTYLARLRAANVATQRARSVLEEALASMDEGFLLWDADDRVRSWNERYLAMFPHMRDVIEVGLSLRRMTEVAAAAILPDGDAATRAAWAAQRAARRRSDGILFEQQMPDGRIISAVERRTRTGGIVSIYRDVTQDRAAARELERARHAAESANEAKTRFLATMSHEIRTPLNGILGMNELMLLSRLDDRQRRQAETIRDSGNMLLAIVNDILDMSRLEAGAMTLELSPFDPQRLVDETITLLQPRAAARGTVLRAEPAPVPALVGDAVRLRQVLINLVGNAVKFTDRGDVVVSSSARESGAGRMEWRLCVRDTGIGIPAEALPTLFDRFTQADSSTSRRYGGSGLGLAICRQLVGLMNGTIEVRSQPGQGSEFDVRVELAVAPPASASVGSLAQPAAAPDGTRRLRVLVAEDNPVNQMLMSEMLAQMGHGCEIAGNGREALERVRSGGVDVVLMDIQMPEMDGVAATQAIRSLSGAVGQTPIVAVTANVLADQRSAYLAAGMDEYIAKPVSHDRLLSVLQRMATRS